VYDSSSWPAIGGMTAIWTMGLVGLYLDSCYKNDMSRKNKALALIVLCLFLASAAGACSSFVGQKSKSNVETAEDDGEEEVLDPNGHDDEELASSDEESAERTGGGILVSVTYLVMMLGAAALPFLVLL